MAVSDSFDRADSPTLGTSDSGHLWVARPSFNDVSGAVGGTSNLGIFDNAAGTADGHQDVINIATIDHGSADGTVAVDCYTRSLSGGNGSGLVLRWVSANTMLMVLGYLDVQTPFNIGAGGLYVREINGGVLTDLHTQAGRFYVGRMTVTLNGSSVRVQFDGDSQADVTVTSTLGLTSPHHGIHTYYGAAPPPGSDLGVQLDNLGSVTAGGFALGSFAMA